MSRFVACVGGLTLLFGALLLPTPPKEGALPPVVASEIPPPPQRREGRRNSPPAAPYGVETNISNASLRLPLIDNDDARCRKLPMNPVPVPRGDGRYDAEYAADMRNDRPPFTYDRPVRIALCLFGRSAPTVEDVSTTPQQRMLTQRIRTENMARMVTDPAKALHPTGGDVTFDTFVFTTSPEYVEAIEELVKPVRLEVGNTLSSVHSMLHSLWLMWDYSRERKVSYDRVLLLRNDVFFLQPIPWTRLHPRLFYVANWCRALGHPFIHSPDDTLCYPLSLYPDDFVHNGVPDYVFLGPARDFELVFGTLIEDINSCRTRRTTASNATGIIGGQLERLYNARKIRLGRFMIHHLDYDLHRAIDDARLELIRRNQTWIAARHGQDRENLALDMKEWVPRRWSWCGNGRAYCRGREGRVSLGFTNAA